MDTVTSPEVTKIGELILHPHNVPIIAIGRDGCAPCPGSLSVTETDTLGPESSLRWVGWSRQFRRTYPLVRDDYGGKLVG